MSFNDVAPIMYARCASCHRPGEAAPFSLLTYDDVRRRASQIVEVTSKRFMPPWLPEEGHGEFANSRRLSDDEIQTIANWVAAGSPPGEAATAPPSPTFAEGWQLGEPDLVLKTPPFELAGDGRDVFRNFVVPIELDAPKWVEAVELRPTNPRVTHHARLGVDNSGESVRRDSMDEAPGYEGMAWGQDPDGQLVTWVPGMVANRGARSSAWRLQPATNLVLHTHLQPSGKRERVQFHIGLHLAEQSSTERPVILRVGSRDIDIPAGEANHRVADRYELPIDVTVHSIFPHVHSLCREVQAWAELPDGTRQELLKIRDFDEKWHDNYRYAQPLKLPRGTKLHAEFVYDNSEANVRNRHRPPVRTVYGSNVDDEMADVHLQVTASRADQRAVLLEDIQLREYESAVAGFRKSIAVHPDDPWAPEGLAIALMGLGQPAEASRVLEARLQRAKPEVHVVTMLGFARLAAGGNERAESSFRQALEMDDMYPLAWLGLGKSLAATRRLLDAEAAYRRAVELAPALAAARIALGSNLLEQSALDAAVREFAAAHQAAPDDPTPLMMLAEIRARQQRDDESLALLRAACDVAPYTYPPKVLLGVFKFQNGDVAAARRLLSEAHTELPEHPVPAFYLAQLAHQSGELATARRLLEEAATLATPDNWPKSQRNSFAMQLNAERQQLARELGDAN